MPAVDDLLRRIGQAAPDAKYIRAYHGSPYDFDKFDAAKIGLGEGEQAYGHGMYFAGSEDVARGYRDALRWRGADTSIPSVRASSWVHRHGGEGPAAEALERAISKSPFGKHSLDARLNQSALDFLKSGEPVPPAPPGRMYEVAIAHPETSLLDWDAPMSAQPSVIQREYGSLAMGMPGDGGRVWRDIQTRLAEAYDDDLAGGLSAADAAKELLTEGIPGIRYMSKERPGTPNYVMFPGTEDSIRILRKYGMLAPIPAAAAMRDGDTP